MITARDELRELRARAIMSEDQGKTNAVYHLSLTKHSKLCEEAPLSCGFCKANRYRDQAEATMKAEEEAGLAVCPGEATATMKSVGWSAQRDSTKPAPFNQCADGINAAISTGNLLIEKEPNPS